ncbi:MAG: HNH endonuclease [Rhizobiales bacterium]|nr:HNH endonuclease [Hyphomicrobiales bacterium]
MAKDRTPVPIEISTEVLFQQDHTCCVCRERGKSVQIHHIDEDPTNHAIDNLSLLCLEDHNRTLLKGGFGKNLLPDEVRRYRDDWIERVQNRRQEADVLAITAMGSAGVVARKIEGEWSAPPLALLTAYVDHLPELRRAAYENAQHDWDTGATVPMRRATADIIDILERVLVYMANWYPEDHFSERGSAAYFSEFIAGRYHWHRALFEPTGPGSGGTLAGLLAAGGALTDVENAVEQMVEGLTAGDVDLIKWRQAWKEAGERQLSFFERLGERWKKIVEKIKPT